MTKDMLSEFNDATPKATVEVAEFDHLIVTLRQFRDRKDELAAEAKKLNEEVDLIEAKILNLLKQTGKERWEVPGYGLAYKSTKLEVRFPDKLEERKLLEGYVKEKYGEEMRGSLFTINYQSLNKFFKEEYEKAAESGKADSFVVPGLAAPTSRETIGFRRK